MQTFLFRDLEQVGATLVDSHSGPGSYGEEKGQFTSWQSMELTVITTWAISPECYSINATLTMTDS